jgi:glycosyltransferase involved in cell wall biosynthesis
MNTPLIPRKRDPFISLVVPVFNEQEVIDLFLERTSQALDDAGLDYEFVFVNDGSSDQTLPMLILLSAENRRVRVIDLSRNFGKEAALTAGIHHVRGDALVPIDVDLQDPPELIPRFVEKWREGYDVVYGVRTRRDEDSWRNRFMKGLFSWVGFRAASVSYERPARAAGQTKWNLLKLWNFALDGIVSFSTAPLRVWSYIGVIISLLSFIYAVIAVMKVLLFGVDVPGYASLLVVVLFLGGIQLISLGIIGEYLGRLFLETKARPVYVIDRVYEGGVEKED